MLDQGRIIESGSFGELVAKNGRFAELARAVHGRRGGAREGGRVIEAPMEARSAVMRGRRSRISLRSIRATK
jgi:hypothetical protein